MFVGLSGRQGIAATVQDVREKKIVAVPKHLQDTHYPGAKRLKTHESQSLEGEMTRAESR